LGPHAAVLTQERYESTVGDVSPGFAADHSGSGVTDGLDWLFIIGTGRSGSTTLLDMINHISPQVYLAGEHFGVVKQLHNVYATSTRFLESHPRDTSAGPFSHQHINSTKLLEDLRHYAYDAIGDFDRSTVGIVGFKEVQGFETVEQLDWLKTLFPCARYVVNWRKNITKQHESAFAKSKSIEHFKDTTAALHRWAQQQPDGVAFSAPLEDFSSHMFNRLLRWLHFGNCTFQYVLHDNHHGFAQDKRTGSPLVGKCARKRGAWCLTD
jgi:hypothetical protein